MPECIYPLTGVGCIDRVYTDLGTFEITPQGVRVLELFDVTSEQAAELVGDVALYW